MFVNRLTRLLVAGARPKQRDPFFLVCIKVAMQRVRVVIASVLVMQYSKIEAEERAFSAPGLDVIIFRLDSYFTFSLHSKLKFVTQIYHACLCTATSHSLRLHLPHVYAVGVALPHSASELRMPGRLQPCSMVQCRAATNVRTFEYYSFEIFTNELFLRTNVR